MCVLFAQHPNYILSSLHFSISSTVSLTFIKVLDISAQAAEVFECLTPIMWTIGSILGKTGNLSIEGKNLKSLHVHTAGTAQAKWP